MSLEAQIKRTPRAFDVELGRAAAERLELSPGLRALVAGATGSSPYLASLVGREGAWLASALDKPEAALDALVVAAREAPADAISAELRRAKRRLALILALADLGGAWPLETVTAALTRFADVAVVTALAAALAAELKRSKGAEPPALVVVAMGKMGAFELNYSSDIDLICLFDESAAGERYAEHRTVAIRATRRMAALLSEITAEGYVFRTDLRLRPDPAATPVCLSMDAAERYYESLGRTWERAAWIKGRAVAGAIQAGEAFIERLRPFIWRRHLDFNAIRDAHDMRLRIREHRGLGGRQPLEGHDVKLGRGGIREIEFFTQTRQIIAGGRDPSLRVRGTVEGLARLASAGWVPEEVARTLTADYRALRQVEHRLQMIADAQTHQLPGDDEGFARLAALMDTEAGALKTELRERFDRVAELTEPFFAPKSPRADASESEALSDENQAIVARWESYPALRSPRAVEIFERIRPAFLTRLAKATQPAKALTRFDAFLAALPAGVQIFALFEANPALVDLLVDIADTAPELARYLGRNAGVFDAVIGGDFFAPWPGAAQLAADLSRRLAAQPDYERQLDEARRWQKEWHFRIGVHHLRALADAGETGRAYADLAEATLAALWPVVIADFESRHGPQPGQGAAVLGMGSLGAGWLTAASDLDLLVIYDAEGQASSDGPRPLAARAYFARLTQALVTALSAPTAEGRLYEVDMRLRPSGRQGPVATSFDAFRTYQTGEAWTWEHLALTRARPLAGSETVGAAIEAFRRSLLAAPRDRDKTLADVAAMRRRLFAARPPRGPYEARLGAGRLQDIELLAQTGALLSGDPAHALGPQIDAAAGASLIDEAGRETLAASTACLRAVQLAGRLMTGDAVDGESAASPFFLREAGSDDPEGAAVRVRDAAEAAARVIEPVFATCEALNGT